ncbi:MAG: restriction endonuclease subunit S [Bacteroidetes bacterium]|nr:restriction endonuclease subunit S [Bacteroidota bacterium]
MKYLDYLRMSNEKQNKIIPKLRFPEFENVGEWESKTLGQIGNVLMCKRIFAEETNEKEGVPFFKIGTLGGNSDAYISKELFNEYKSKYNFPRKGEVLITCSGTIGKCFIYNGGDAYYQDSNIVWIDNPRLDVSNEMIFLLLTNVNWGRLNSTTITRIYGSDLRGLQLQFPKQLEEQQKIADCLFSLDELITALTQKLEALKEHKKGLMQQLFPGEGETVPRLRFPEFEGSVTWEEKIFGDVATFLKGKGISKIDIVQNGNLPCIRYGELYTYYKETIDSIKSYTNLSPDELVLSTGNDVIIPASGETKEDIATAACVLNSGIALGGDLHIIRSKMNGVFLSYFLNNAKKREIAQLAQGYSVVHLYSEQLKKLNICIPKFEEQQKIADCLSSLDELITSQTEKIETLKLHKKGLMQQLFPAISNINTTD